MLTLLCSSFIYLSQSKESPSMHTQHDRGHDRRPPNGAKADITGADSAHVLLSAHDVWQDYGDDWAGASTLADGSHNPNEIVGWGSASASAWTQSKPDESEVSAADSVPQQPQQPQQPQSGYSTGYSSGYGYQQQPAAGYGYQAPQTGYSTGYQQPSTGFGYTATGSSGFGYGDDAASSGYTSSGFGETATGQMPGGQKPMGAPGAQQGMGMMPGAQQGAPGAAQGLSGINGGAAGAMQGSNPQSGGQTSGGISGKCPLPHRHRKPWTLLTIEQKDLFIEGFQAIRKNGKLDIFAQVHAQHDVENYVHYTSLFTFYHAYLVWEVESAIRDLGGKFACFTMPYYDFTLDAGKEDDPHILHSGLGGDGDADNNYCVVDDETGFSWQTCNDYTPWRSVEEEGGSSTEEDDNNDVVNDDDNNDANNVITYSAYDDAIELDRNSNNNKQDVSYTDYGDILHPLEIDYDAAYDEFVPRDDDDFDEEDELEDFLEEEEEEEALLEADAIEEQCYWTQANCKASETSPFCCLKRKKSSTVLLPSASEIGDAIYRSKNIKEFQGYLNEYYNRVQAFFGTSYYAHMANGYATEDPIFWMTMSFITHLRMLWQDCWNYNNIPKDKLDMHYNSYHPYCGTFDATPSDCANYNLGLDAPMNFYELQKQDWSYASHKIVTVRKLWAPEYWNVIYELGPFYTSSGVNNWCDNNRDSEWFIETLEYENVDEINTELNVFGSKLRENMIRDGVDLSSVFKTVSALSCKYNRKYSANSCYDEVADIIEGDLEDDEDAIEYCETEDIDIDGLLDATLDDFLDYDGVRDNECLRKIRRESFPYAEHSMQVKKQLCKGDWDYQCPQYNELLYSDYEEALKNPIDVGKILKNKNNKSYFAQYGWIWIVSVNAILVVVVVAACLIWHCCKDEICGKKQASHDGDNNNAVTVNSYGVITVDDDDENDDNQNTKIMTTKTGADDNGIIDTIQENEEYQPLLV